MKCQRERHKAAKWMAGIYRNTKKDVLRRAAMLAPSDRFENVPQTLKKDVSHFCDEVKDELPGHDFFKSAGLRNITGEQVLEQLKSSFL